MKKLVIISSFMVLFVATGCARPLGGESPPTRFYVLSAIVPADKEATGTESVRGPTVGVVPVVLAEHLQHQGIVTRDSQNQVTLAKFDQWAAPLGENASIILGENLTLLIPTDRVLLLPTSRAIDIDYRVETDIVQFERDADGSVILVARWVILDGAARKELAFGRSVYRTPVSGPSVASSDKGQSSQPSGDSEAYQATVAAMSTALAELSGEIATAIQSLDQKRSARRRRQ